MRPYHNLRRFILLIILGFCSIFAWSIFTAHTANQGNIKVNFTLQELSSKSIHNYDSTSPKIITPIHNYIDSNEVTASNNNFNTKISSIDCNINGEYKISCLKVYTSKEPSVYIPFSFIKKYFEINGKIVHSKNQDIFEWNHSYSKIYYPDQPYDPLGKFLWFENYNVETRERVKCVSGIEQVPISTQWYTKGHFYPTQIAQYGLSYFSKNISEGSPKRVSLIKEGIFSKIVSTFSLSSNKSENFSRFRNTTVLNLKSSKLNYPIFDLNLRVLSNSIISFFIKDLANQEYCLQYETSDFDLISYPNKTIKFGTGISKINTGWFVISRDLLVDLFKANLIPNRKLLSYRIDRIVITGQLDIRKFTLTTAAHGRFSKAAGDWLVRKQNSLGGWDIKVKRKLRKISGGTLILKEGWHSSMAQGQAMSLLTRLYSTTQATKYLTAAKKALAIFEKESFQNGVKAVFFDKYVWYEEYPTVPSIFVLNGFIYSLFGLYDLSKSCSDQSCEKAGHLFEEGVRSLENMLPLFDSGSGTFYDLRHLSLASAPNVARWDYHTTHINQLLQLYTIVRRDIFKVTADRWIAYMKGHRAPHN